MNFTLFQAMVLSITIFVVALTSFILGSPQMALAVICGGAITGFDFLFISFTVETLFKKAHQVLMIFFTIGLSFKLVLTAVLFTVCITIFKLNPIHLILGVSSAILSLIISAVFQVRRLRRHSENEQCSA